MNMKGVGDFTTIVLIFVFVFLLLALIKIFHNLWWVPTRFQKFLSLQGVNGPPYKFIQGNTKEILTMMKAAKAKPISELSNFIFPKLQPNIHYWANLYGKVYLQWYGTRALLVILEPELVKEILINKEGAYIKQNWSLYVKKILGDGLAMSQGEKWTKMRKLANFAFHGESLKGMTPAMIASVETMLEKWNCDEGKEIEVYEEFRLLTAEVISRTAFGSSYKEGSAIFEMLAKLSLLASRNMLTVRLPGISKIFKTKDEREAEKLEKTIHQSIVELIKKREDKVMNKDADNYGNDFLGLLVKANHDDNISQRISIDDVVDECKTFYFAGQETTNSWLAWTILLLSIHTEWQEEARKEVFTIFGKQNPNLDGIPKLKILNQIIHESLRLYPSLTSLARKTRKEVRLGHLNLPANAIILISILSLHHDPEIWGHDSHLFKPERFSQGVAKATKDNMAAFLPFGIGPRSCVGINFAINEAKIVLTMILQRYSFTLSPTYVHSPLSIITNRPQYGVQVMLQLI
ncbi:cytochrome P450 CYP749A22 [Cannabis sativa]|uniref:cytochrome P450 CYP749A22 n=1 Tax=Cannabis sativa TaxID=3483 RepID=UPI0029CA34FB|nr:cytochrome P450 CYP749A22 [Cannabis sativa]